MFLFSSLSTFLYSRTPAGRGKEKCESSAPVSFPFFSLSQIKGKGRAGLARPRVESSDRFLLRPPLQSLASPPFPTDPGGKKNRPPSLYLLCRFLGPSFFFSKRIRVTRSRNDRIKKSSPFSPLLSSDRPSMQVSFPGLATPSPATLGRSPCCFASDAPSPHFHASMLEKGRRPPPPPCTALSFPPPLSPTLASSPARRGSFSLLLLRRRRPPLPRKDSCRATKKHLLVLWLQAVVVSHPKKLLLQKSKISSPLREARKRGEGIRSGRRCQVPGKKGGKSSTGKRQVQVRSSLASESEIPPIFLPPRASAGGREKSGGSDVRT